MIIDFHTHIFPDKIAKPVIEDLSAQANILPNSDGTANGLISNMENSGVSISIALPVVTKPEQFDSINKFALFVNQNYFQGNKKILSFGGIHPKCNNIKDKMRFLKSCGFKGVKIHPDYQQTFIDDESYIEIFMCAKEFDLIVVTHSGVDDGFPNSPIRCTPSRILNVLDKVNYNKIVFAHYGANKMWREVLETIAGKNVYIDTALTINKIDEVLFIKILRKHGDDKVLFATDNPWSNAKKDVETLNKFNINKNTLDKILYKNAQNLLNI